MDNFFITSCQHATVEEIHALGIPFEFTWYRLVGRLAHLDFQKSLGTLLSCTMEARYQLQESMAALKAQNQEPSFEEGEKIDALMRYLEPMKYEDGEEPLTLSFGLIKDVIDPTLDVEYEWIGVVRDIESKRVFQTHSQRRLNNFDPNVYLKLVFSLKYWVTGESRKEDYMNENSKLPHMKPDFYSIGEIEEEKDEERSKREQKEFGVNNNLLSEMMKVKESFAEEKGDELEEEDLPQDFWSQKSD